MTGYIILHFFLTRHPVRIVTTSADHSQLEAVLWGEIRRFIQTCRLPLEHNKGGPLVVNHLRLRKVIGPELRAKAAAFGGVVEREGVTPGTSPSFPNPAAGDPTITLSPREAGEGKTLCGLSYCIGRVAAKGEGMLGHHIADIGDGIPRTLFVSDEASGVDDLAYDRAVTWARRVLVIGNPYNGPPGCTFFKKGVQEGDLLAKQEHVIDNT